MLTTAFVLILRPLQLLLACAALSCASVDQFYLGSNARLIALLALILPSTLFTISATIQTTFAWYNGLRPSGWASTLRWLWDLAILLLLGGAVAMLMVTRDTIRYRSNPPVPFLTGILVLLGVNAAFFVATTAMLVIEDALLRTRRRRLDEEQQRAVIVHTTHNEAILGPRPDVPPREIFLDLPKLGTPRTVRSAFSFG